MSNQLSTSNPEYSLSLDNVHERIAAQDKDTIQYMNARNVKASSLTNPKFMKKLERRIESNFQKCGGSTRERLAAKLKAKN